MMFNLENCKVNELMNLIQLNFFLFLTKNLN